MFSLVDSLLPSLLVGLTDKHEKVRPVVSYHPFLYTRTHVYIYLLHQVALLAVEVLAEFADYADQDSSEDGLYRRLMIR